MEPLTRKKKSKQRKKTAIKHCVTRTPSTAAHSGTTVWRNCPRGVRISVEYYSSYTPADRLAKPARTWTGSRAPGTGSDSDCIQKFQPRCGRGVGGRKTVSGNFWADGNFHSRMCERAQEVTDGLASVVRCWFSVILLS